MTKARLLFSCLLLLSLCLCGISAAQAPAEAATPHAVVLHAARLFDVKSGRVVKPGEVLVQGDRIVAAGASVKRPAGAEVIDLGDRTLMPGLIDAQVQLF